MRKLYVYKTRVGPFYIAEHNGRFHPVFAEESLGSYVTAQQAVEDLGGGILLIHRVVMIRQNWAFQMICQSGSVFLNM